MSATPLLIQVISSLVRSLGKASGWLGLLVLIQLVLTPFLHDKTSLLIIWTVPLSILFVTGKAAYDLVRSETLTLLTPIPIFLGWSAMVFGVGPLFKWIAPPHAVFLNPRVFSSNPTDYPKVALLTSIGLFLTISSSKFVLTSLRRYFSKFLPFERHLVAENLTMNTSSLVFLNSSKVLRIGYFLLLLSFIYRLVDILWANSFSSFGFLSVSSRVGIAGIFILGLTGSHKSRVHLTIAFLFALYEFYIGISTGMRSEALLPFVSLLAAYYINSKSLKSLAVGVVGLSLLLIFITPITYNVRQLTWPGNYEAGPLAAVAQAVSLAEETRSNEDTLFSVWRRIDYSHWQEAMMYQYDTGKPGNTYRYIPWNFVPRILFPNKPRLEIGTDIGYAIQAVDGSSSFSGTVYGEMYWNGGWFAVIISSFLYGAILGFISVLTLWLFSQSSWPSILIGLYGILYGFTVDAHFSVNAIGRASIFFSLALLYRYIAPFLGFRLNHFSCSR